MLNLLIQYYTATYMSMNFRSLFINDLNSIVIQNRTNQYGRYRIGSEIFDSAILSRHVKSLFVLAQFVNHNESVDTYPGQIQYFFTYSVNLLNGIVKHKLAYIWWYRLVNSAKIQFYFNINNETCNVELWDKKFYSI